MYSIKFQRMKVRVQNYQAIKDATLTVERLTVLKGSSNNGKSSLLKAIYAATHNRFRSGCVRWGEDSAVIVLQYTGEKNVLRVERSALGASPKVRLGNKQDGYLKFDKMNRDVPTEIRKYNNFGEVRLSPTESLDLNFSNQFAEPLMVRFSNKKIVDILSHSKATQDAESARKYIVERNAELRGELSSTDAALATTKEQLGECQKKLQAFHAIKRVESLYAEIEENSIKLDLYEQLISQAEKIKACRENIEKSSRILEEARSLKELEGKVEGFQSLYSQIGQIKRSQLAVQKAEVIVKVAMKVAIVPLEGLRDLRDNLKAVKKASSCLVESEQLLQKIRELKELEVRKENLYTLMSMLSLKKPVRREAIIARYHHMDSIKTKLSTVVYLLSALETKNLVQSAYGKAVEVNENRVCPICGAKL